MEKLRRDHGWEKGLLTALFLLACFQNLTLASIGSGASLKWVHVFSLVFLPFLCRKKKELRVNRPVLLYVAYAAAVSLLHRSEFGVNSLLLNYIFGLYLVVLCANFGADLSKDDWLDIVSGAASILMIVILIKNLIYYQGFLDYLRAEGMAHPWGVKMIIGGGSNIESSWLGLLAFFFCRSRWKWLYAGANLMLSFLYGSRAGMLIAAAAILWLFAAAVQAAERTESADHGAGALRCTGRGSVGVRLLESLVLRSLNRFLHGMEDAGNAGRIRMWTYALETSKAYPFGCGVGNCMKALSGVAGFAYGEDNIHNVYLQNLIDCGWLGGAAYLALVVRFFWMEKKKLLHDPFVAALFTYCGASLLQFRGGDTLAFLLLGMYLAYRDADNKKENWVVKIPLGKGKETL